MIDRVEQDLPIEDSRVELKAKWIDNPNHVARRIAGQCNANAGDNVLWLIGVSETDGVVGVDHQDMAKWWPGICSQFDGQPPAVRDIVVTYDGQVVVALLFDTDRVPFVVRNAAHGQQGGGGGPVEREVPWREGTSTRSATHSDLVRLLVPVSEVPRLELHRAEAHSSTGGDENQRVLNLTVNVYAVVPLGAALVLPDHQAYGTYSIPMQNIKGDLEIQLLAASWSPSSLRAYLSNRSPSTPDTRRHTVHQGDEQILLDGPGFFRLTSQTEFPNIESGNSWESVGPLEVTLSVRPAGSDLSATIQALLVPYFERSERENLRSHYGWRSAAGQAMLDGPQVEQVDSPGAND